MKRSVLRMVGVLAMVAMVTAGCGGGSGGAGGDVDLSDASLTVGSKDFTEQLILGFITLQALEDAGASVEDQIGLAGTDAARQALINGDIDMYWEYTGTIWITHLGNTKPIPDSQEQYDAAAKADREQNDLRLLDPAPFNNTYALAIREEAAQDVGVEKLSDLKQLAQDNPDEATICVESEFNSRDDGLPGLEETYGFQFPEGNVELFDTGVVYQQTDEGDRCNFGEVFTTDGRIEGLGLTVIEDDKNFFPKYNPALEMRQETFAEYGPQLQELFNPIADALTAQEMTQLNARVDVDGELPEDVAEDWLSEKGFVE